MKKQGILLATLIAALIVIGGCTSHTKVYHIGILSGWDSLGVIADNFKAEMTRIGYIEGRNVIYDVQKSNVSLENYTYAIREFIEERVDLIFTFPTEASIVAKNVTYGTGIPVVFSFANIERNDIVENISHPGGNITGVRFPGPENSVMQLEIMKELLPDAKRFFVCYQEGYPSVPIETESLRNASRRLNVTLVELAASEPSEISDKLESLSGSDDTKVDAIILIAEPLCRGIGLPTITKFAFENDIPIGGGDVNSENMIFSYNSNNSDYGMLSAVLADKILRGASAGSLPVITPVQKLSLNYKTAQRLGINISDGFLSMADTVVH